MLCGTWFAFRFVASWFKLEGQKGLLACNLVRPERAMFTPEILDWFNHFIHFCQMLVDKGCLQQVDTWGRLSVFLVFLTTQSLYLGIKDSIHPIIPSRRLSWKPNIAIFRGNPSINGGFYTSRLVYQCVNQPESSWRSVSSACHRFSKDIRSPASSWLKVGATGALGTQLPLPLSASCDVPYVSAMTWLLHVSVQDVND